MHECVNVLLLEEALNVLDIVERVVEVEFEVRDDAQLFAFSEAETTAQVGSVFSYECQETLLRAIAYNHDGKVYACYGEIRGDAHTCDCDKRRAKERFHLTEEDVSHVLLDEAADFILACTLHGLPPPTYTNG
jgi:hypothetical protein